MSDAPSPRDPEPFDDRRRRARGWTDLVLSMLYSILRWIARHVRTFWGALLTVSFIVGLAAGVVFGLLAGIVMLGVTQAFDERVLRFLASHRNPGLDHWMLEITSLGNGLTLIVLVAVASVFLWITRHRWSVAFLLLALLGGQLLNGLLKEAFARPRPGIVSAIAEVSSASFPSGHAMAATVAYGAVGYLAARLAPTRRLRHLTWLVAGVLILGIGLSRMYLGVHYPSDVVAGFLGGIAWVALLAAAMTALQFFAPRRPETLAEERDLERPTLPVAAANPGVEGAAGGGQRPDG